MGAAALQSAMKEAQLPNAVVGSWWWWCAVERQRQGLSACDGLSLRLLAKELPEGLGTESKPLWCFLLLLLWLLLVVVGVVDQSLLGLPSTLVLLRGR